MRTAYPPAPTVPLSSLSCHHCGRTPVMAVQPGTTRVQCLGVFPIRRPVPLRAWCLGCWPRSWQAKVAA